jgi:arsenate reductase
MAEAILNQLGGPELRGISAGSRPTGQVHPIALTCLNHNRTPVDHPRSKSWDEFSAEHIDLVITVCDNAAGEACPVFPGLPAKLHWGLPDPASAKGSPDEIFTEFQSVYDQLHALIAALVNAFEKRADDSVDAWLRDVDFVNLLPQKSQ